MNQLTQEQKARIFATYLGCQIQFDTVLGDKEIVAKETLKGVCNCAANYGLEASESIDFDDCYLILIHVFYITDEDAAEVARLGGMGSFAADRIAEQGRILLIDHMNNNRCAVSGNEWIRIYQYLTQKGYAVPLFIAPRHPDNGMTAIEMGLAIEAK